MTTPLDEAWRVVRTELLRRRVHHLEQEDYRAISQAVGQDLISRGLVLTFEHHAEVTQTHCESLLDDLRYENALLRRRLDEGATA